MQGIGARRGHLVHLRAILLPRIPDRHVVGRNLLFGLAILVHVMLLREWNACPPERLPAAAVGPAMASPSEIYQRARKTTGQSVVGWALDREERIELLLQFPPLYANVVADHVTLAARVGRDAPLPEPVHGEIVGRADDGKGVEAMVVRIAGNTDRPDGSSWHITWSLAESRRAVESNDVIATHGWEPLALPMPVVLTPARWPR